MFDLGAMYRDFIADEQPTRADKLQGLLANQGQMPAIPQGGMNPQEFIQSPQMQPNSPLQQAQMYGGMLDAGYNATEAGGMMGLLNPQQGGQMFSQGYESPKDQIDAVNALRNPYVKAMTAPRKAMNNYNDAVDIVGSSDWGASGEMLSGSDSVALVKKYLKQVLPDESVMGDDIRTLLDSQGTTEQMKSLVNRFLGESGTISKVGVSEIMKSMATMAQSASSQRDLTRAQYETEAGQYKLPTTFMGERINIKENPLSFELWKKSQGY